MRSPVTLMEGLLLTAGLGAFGYLAWTGHVDKRRAENERRLAAITNYTPRTLSIFCDPEHKYFDHAECDGHIRTGFSITRDCHCDCHAA